MKVIGHIFNNYDEKFGIPRQSGIVNNISKISFEDEFNNYSFFKGLEEFSYIWLIWEFSENTDKDYKAMVRPPKLGGNEKKGVFATRSPFRPNSIGISSVKVTKISNENNKIEIYVEGADIKNGTPILDIKPYLPYTDIHSDATNGFADSDIKAKYDVCIKINDITLPCKLLSEIADVLGQNPAPGYKDKDKGAYKIYYAGLNIEYLLDNNQICIKKIYKTNDFK